MVELTAAGFDGVVASGVTLVDFYTPNCGPCKMLVPQLLALEKELQGKAKIAKVDVLNEDSLAQRFKVQAVPTLVLFKDGKAVTTFVGVRYNSVLSEAINQAL